MHQAEPRKLYCATGSSGFVVRVVDTMNGVTRLLVAGRFEIVPVVWIATDIHLEMGLDYIHHPSAASLLKFTFNSQLEWLELPDLPPISSVESFSTPESSINCKNA